MPMNSLMTKTAIFDVAATILANASVALAGSSKGKPKRVLLQPGLESAWDNCQCGQLSLLVVNRYAGRGLSTANGTTQWNCEPIVRSVVMQMDIVRCVPGPNENGNPPSPGQLTDAFQVQEEDAYLVWNSVQCTLHQLENDKTIAGQIIIDQPSLGPLGNCGGSRLNFSVDFWRDCDCGAL